MPTHKPGPYKSPLHEYDKGLCVGVFYAEYGHVLQLWNSRASIPTHKPGPYKSPLHKYDKGLCVQGGNQLVT